MRSGAFFAFWRIHLQDIGGHLLGNCVPSIFWADFVDETTSVNNPSTKRHSFVDKFGYSIKKVQQSN
jgi:hypothetical protein